MPTINKLCLTDTLSDSDQFPIWQPNNGDARRVAASVLYAYILSKFVTDNIISPVATVAQIQYRLTLLGYYDAVNAAMPSTSAPETIAWRVGGPVTYKGNLSNLIQTTLSYTDSQMIAFLQASAAIVM